MSSAQVRCVITGASGFIGQALAPYLRALGHSVTEWPRGEVYDLASNESDCVSEKWVAQLKEADVVIHLAGLAHQSQRSKTDLHFFKLNRDGTLRLASAAKAAGVKRFIFLSTAKVFGEGGTEIYNAATMPAPVGAYAQSKWQAEQLLLEQFSQTMELVILRPPLVYGSEAKANFAHLLTLARLPIPLPFAGVKNRRALIGIDNLIDLVALCVTHPAAAGKTLLCADAQHYSLTDILVSIRDSLDRKPLLFQLPSSLLAKLRGLLNTAISDRLFGDFQMDCDETFSALNWKPPFTMQQILRGDIRSRLA